LERTYPVPISILKGLHVVLGVSCKCWVSPVEETELAKDGAIRKTARRNLGWGRSGGNVPVSRLGYAVWGVSFLVIAAALFKSNKEVGPLLTLKFKIDCHQ